MVARVSVALSDDQESDESGRRPSVTALHAAIEEARARGATNKRLFAEAGARGQRLLAESQALTDQLSLYSHRASATRHLDAQPAADTLPGRTGSAVRSSHPPPLGQPAPCLRDAIAATKLDIRRTKQANAVLVQELQEMDGRLRSRSASSGLDEAAWRRGRLDELRAVVQMAAARHSECLEVRANEQRALERQLREAQFERMSSSAALQREIDDARSRTELLEASFAADQQQRASEIQGIESILAMCREARALQAQHLAPNLDAQSQASVSTRSTLGSPSQADSSDCCVAPCPQGRAARSCRRKGYPSHVGNFKQLQPSDVSNLCKIRQQRSPENAPPDDSQQGPDEEPTWGTWFSHLVGDALLAVEEWQAAT